MTLEPSGQAVDERWMSKALALALQGKQQGEVPVGALLVRDGKQIGAGFNCPIGSCDSTAHAEIVALREACAFSANYRLPDTTLYVTLEPCMMCAGAMVHARVGRLVYGAREPKAGVVHSHGWLDADWLNHKIEIQGGVLEQQCGDLLSVFFSALRAGAV